jgi:hypothetical protein
MIRLDDKIILIKETIMFLRGLSAWVLFVFSASAWAISPYIQGDPVAGGSAQARRRRSRPSSRAAASRWLASISPRAWRTTAVVVATDDAMLKEVGSVGGHAILGAAIRVGVKADGSVHYTNPDYWYRAYFRKCL